MYCGAQAEYPIYMSIQPSNWSCSSTTPTLLMIEISLMSSVRALMPDGAGLVAMWRNKL